MKKLFLGIVSLLLAVTMVFAQESTPEEKAQKIATEWVEKLQLTEEQQAPIYTAILEHVTAKHAVKSDASLDPVAQKAKMEELDAVLDAKVSEVLTDEQKVEYAKIVAEKKAKKEAKESAPPIPPTPIN